VAPWLATVMALSAALVVARAEAHSAAARDLEGRLIAPCWTQTLGVHNSPVAEQLPAEIAQRLSAAKPRSRSKMSWQFATAKRSERSRATRNYA
jgi:hypothetical protein